MTNESLFRILLIFIVCVVPKCLSVISLGYKGTSILKHFSRNNLRIKYICKTFLAIGFLILGYSFLTDFNYLNILAVFFIFSSFELSSVLNKSME